MRAYLLDDSHPVHNPNGKLWMAFGEDAVDAANHLIQKIGGSTDVNRFSVGGSWEVDPTAPINISSLWPYFTNYPNRHARD